MIEILMVVTQSDGLTYEAVIESDQMTAVQAEEYLTTSMLHRQEAGQVDAWSIEVFTPSGTTERE